MVNELNLLKKLFKNKDENIKNQLTKKKSN